MMYFAKDILAVGERLHISGDLPKEIIIIVLTLQIREGEGQPKPASVCSNILRKNHNITPDVLMLASLSQFLSLVFSVDLNHFVTKFEIWLPDSMA